MSRLNSLSAFIKNAAGIHNRTVLASSFRSDVCHRTHWPMSFSQHLSVVQHCSSYSKANGDELDQLYKAVDIEVKGHDTAVLNSYETFVKMAAKELDVTISKIWSPPKVIKRYTLLKSVHIYRKHMVQYETRTHFRCFELKHLTGSTANTLLEYIQRNLPEGMAMKVTRHAIEAVPDHLRSSPTKAKSSLRH